MPLVLSRPSIALSSGALAGAAVLALGGAVPPAALAVPWALLGPASLLLAAAARGATHQLRLVVLRTSR